MANDFDSTNGRGEYPFDPAEIFTPGELDHARLWRGLANPDRQAIDETHRTDNCPHRPQCPTMAVCLQEIAWYLRHKAEFDREDPLVLDRRRAADLIPSLRSA